MPTRYVSRSFALSFAVFGGFLLSSCVRPLTAQSLTVGGLTATILDDRGVAMRDVSVTVERAGLAVRTLETDHAGVVNFPILTPGSYSVLAEELGYQPVRMTGVLVVSGGSTRISFRLVRKPPPINTVSEVPSNAQVTATSTGETLSGHDLMTFARREDITNTSDAFAKADAPLDGRNGWIESGDGLAPRFSTLVVDGVREALLRQPALRGDPVSAPLFGRDALGQVSFSQFAADAEWPPVAGALLGAQTARGSTHFSFDPWISVSSAKLGDRHADNPADSSATSVRAGLSMGGPIKGDTAGWFVQADYQRVALPSADPFSADIAGPDSGDVSAAVGAAAQQYHQDVSRWLSPTVRTWQGGSGLGRLDWRFGANTLLAVRAAGASWSEDNPDVGQELVNGAGSRLQAHDVSGSVALTTGGDAWSSDTRVGVHTSSRDWFGAALPYTGLVGDGIAIGGAFTLPGNFSDNGVGLYETVTVHAGDHTVKIGGSVESHTINYSWLPGSAGRYEFGDVASFAADQGAYYQAFRSTPAPDLPIHDVTLFAEDSWRPSTGLELFGGLQYTHEGLPTGVVKFDSAWAYTSGVRNDDVPTDTKSGSFGPRGGFTWDASGTGATTVHGTVGIAPGHFDELALAEVAQFDGDVTVRRANGTLTWPELGTDAGTAVGQSITLFNIGVRKPRSYKSDLSLTQRLGQAMTLTIDGAYYHTDYLLRRTDINRAAGSVATGSDGRPIYGSLVQYGGLITPATGSNRRFDQFDMVYGLTSNGYTDDYEAGATLDRHVGRGIDALLTYVYSRTTDNLPGQLSADPADQLSPFPDGLNGASWDAGRSDLDIPHRVAFTVTYTSPGKSPLTLAARYRYRSGLPFTPGFRPGVDANGDGSGNNDPAYVGADIAGVSALAGSNSCLGSQLNQIAGRNSCRDPGVQALDLTLGVPLPIGGARQVQLTVDVFNVIGTATGLYDHAAVLVDPSGTITYDGSGHVVLPLIANPDFGQLLSRRGIPRQIRIGFRVEN